ncbi:glycine-rich domain-containing protein [Massilia sp. PWRC2]|uniref:glycine-rich domain-containing protein n=1 Tax=Massilia sp. PWRC2 TaxID=2804626 RepID=UPI003CF9B4FF
MKIDATIAPIATLDLSTIRTRLMHPHAGLGWSEARTRAAESAYREFLMFAKLLPQKAAVPSADVDYFWHFHILDTKKYADDCARIFGYFLHHQPEVEFDDGAGGRLAPARGAAAYCARDRMPSPARAAALADAASDASSAGYCASPARPAAYCASPARPVAYCAAAARRSMAAAVS